MLRRIAILGWRAAALAIGLVGLVLAAASPTAAAQPLVMTNAADRAGLLLDGPWTYSIDPYRDGLQGFHRGQADLGHRRYDDIDVDKATRDNPGALFEYDMARSPVAQLPASWLTHDATMRHYQGLVWYQRQFEASPKPGQRAFLRFEAVNYTAQVYLNGQLVGSHEGGFTPFTIDVTGQLRAGANQVTVGVDSTPAADGVPPPVTDWENYGGITRSVRLVVTPETFIDDAWIRLTKANRIEARVRLNGPRAAGARVELKVAGLAATVQGVTDAQGVVTASIAAPAALKRWSPDSPTLYDVTVTALDDHLNERIGFRTIEVRGQDILLNGKPIFLRGISLHEEEFAAEPSRTITEASARALLSEVKLGLHGNFVRLAHYPHSETTTRLADEMGLLVWSEIPVYWLVDFSNPRTLGLARTMLRENIERDRNRASVVLWSVGNETPKSEPRTAFLKTLIGDVRTLDDSRLVTAALLATKVPGDGPDAMTVDSDPLAADLDVMAVNTYSGWYGDMPLSKVSALAWKSDLNKPLIFSEFGADALAGFHDPQLKRKFSEDYQAEYYRQTLAMTDKVTFLRGLSPWILKDFRSPRRQHPVYQQGWNRKGLVSPTGQRKEAFHILADHYRALAEGSKTDAAAAGR
jgi:beta-glucuronidase